MSRSLDWLNYHHLRYFWTVAKEGSLQAAADRLRVSPPSISAQIRELEEALGAKLFRRSGRQNVLTDTGQLVLGYADEIFAIGSDLMSAVQQRPTERSLRLIVGIVDSFPKLVAYEILRPAFTEPGVHVVCREGKSSDLLAQLAAHRLDIVLADEPASSAAKFPAFNHRLGQSSISFCATPQIAAGLRRRFPQSLHGAPVFLPSENTPIRRALEAWFRAQQISPNVRAEFDDLALMKAIASELPACVPVPTVVLREAVERYGLQRVGEAKTVRDEFFAITAERRISHPVISRLTEHARQLVFR